MNPLYLAITVIILIICTILITNTMYSNSSYYKNKIGQTDKFKEEIPSELEAINLGSTHAREAFIYDRADINGFNFALQSQTLSYDYNLLKRYSKHFIPGCRVFIPIEPLLFCPIHFAGINNRMYYHFLPREDIIGYSIFVKLAESIIPGLSSITAIKAILQGQTKLQHATLNDSQRNADAEAMIACWKRLFGLSDTVNGEQAKTLQKQMNYNSMKLEEIVDFCIANSFIPIVVILPMTDIMANKFSEGFLKYFVYDNLAHVSDGAIIMDYFSDSRFTKHYELFSDSQYFNKQGACLFTQTVLDETKELVLTRSYTS